MSRRLRSQILSCTQCALGEQSDAEEWHRVPWSGTNASGVAIIGEAPGKDEALTGVPFNGRAGRVLDQAIEVAKLSRDDVWIMNVICCRPPKNDFSQAEEVGAVLACRPWFNAQLEASKAWLVVLVGRSAYQAVFDEDVALTKVRGKGQWMNGRLWIPTWHPAYVLRSGSGQGAVSDEFFSDFRRVGQIIRGELEPPHAMIPSPKIRDAMAEQLEIHFPQEKLRDAIERKGWVRVYSHVLEDHMVVVNETKAPKIPEVWKNDPVWTTDELMRVGWGGRLRVSQEEMRKIQLAKRVLGARVIVA